MLEKMVVGYASDQAGWDAVTLAARIGMATHGSLTVVFPYRPLPTRESSDRVQMRVEAEVSEQLAAIHRGEWVEHVAYRWTPTSWPVHALHELASYEHAELIVLGAAREDIGDRLHVSLMERMVHSAPCAVAVAPAGYAKAVTPSTTQARPEGEGMTQAGALRKIGVGFSSSEEGRAAVWVARELAGLVDGTVKVIAGAGLEPALASYAFSSPALEEVEKEIYADTEQTLARVCRELAATGDVEIERETVRGDPARVLVERTSGLDLLVLGSRAYGPLRHALLGSVSAQTMREAKCPVLVVPRGVTHGDGQAHEQPAGASQRE